MKRMVFTALLMFASSTANSMQVVAADIPSAIQVLQKVQPGGSGSAPAQKAVGSLVESGSEALIPVLKGFQGASPLAANWLRNAFEEIVAAQTKAGTALPAKDLEAFVLDTTQAPMARRLAYETLRAADASVEAKLIPGLLLDPGSEFRRDAVALLIAEAEKSEGAAAIALYRKAMSGAVHEDQVQKIAEALRKAGETVDISRHFGFVQKWMIVGPFDNKDEKGFAVAYAPEKEFEAGKPELQAEYDGQLGKVQWKPVETTDDYGVIDIAKQIENYKGSAMYATTTWKSDKDQTLELRLGTPNAWKIWVNGELVFEREEYHRSSQMDQYTVPLALKAGENIIGVKICQNEMTQEWAQRYQYQIRICDPTGSGVLPAE